MLMFQTEECPTNADDFFASILKMEEDSQLDFSLIGKDLEMIASSPSDSGLSSALSLSYEQQLSPLLSIKNEEEQIEVITSNVNSPQNCMDLESAGSPIQSLGSVDSPVRSIMSSNISSPVTEEITEEMDYGQTLVAVVTPNNTMPNGNATIATEQPAIDIGKGYPIVSSEIFNL